MSPKIAGPAIVWLLVLCIAGCGSPGFQTGNSGGIGGAGGGFQGESSPHSAQDPRQGQQDGVASGAVGPHSILVGDMNLNGVADVADLLILRRIAAGLQEVPANRYADLTGDGKVTEEDCRLLERAVAGLETWPIRSIGHAMVLDIAPDLKGIRDGYSPEPVEVPSSGRFTVDLWALEAVDFEGFALRIDLGDRPGIRIDDIRQGPFLGTNADLVDFRPVIDGDGATVVCRLRDDTGRGLPSGEGVIAHIDLRVLQPGSENTVALEEVDRGLAQSGTVLHGALVRAASQ